MLKRAEECLNAALYLFIYAAEGQGKTRLIGTLSKVPKGKDLGIISADESGPTSLYEAGYTGFHFWQLPGPDQDPFDSAVRGIKTLAAKGCKTIGMDACTVISANAVQFLSGGAGGKALGFDGWQKILSGFLRIEAAAQRCVRQGINFVYTAWETPAQRYMSVDQTSEVSEPGRPWIHGQGKVWLPGKVDGLGRLTSHFKRGEWQGKIQFYASEEWLAKTRWKLPDPCPADLEKIRKLVQQRRALAGVNILKRKV